MKRTKRECLEGNGLAQSGWFYCGELVGEFGGEEEGSFFCWITHFGFFGVDRAVVLMGALFGPGLLWFERGSG